MKFATISRSAIWFLVSACSALALNAAEIELQREVRCSGSLVRLADVAVVHCEEPMLAKRLQAAELFPAPPVDGWVELDNRDLFELLEIRGFDPLDFRLTGAARSVIHGRSSVVPNEQPAVLPASGNAMVPQPMPMPMTPVSVGAIEPTGAVANRQTVAAAENRLAGAIVDYLRRTTGGSYQWKVTTQIDAHGAELFTSGGLEISGGTQPYTGEQAFFVRVHRADGIAERSVKAQVSLPRKVVAASRSLSVGDRLTAADLQLIVPAGATTNRPTLSDLDACVGMEVTRSVAVGQALENDMLRRPVLVQRNAVARLNVRAGGVVVGTKVRAMADGAQGEQIQVQSLFDRQQFTATVVGPQQVEMIAGQ